MGAVLWRAAHLRVGAGNCPSILRVQIDLCARCVSYCSLGERGHPGLCSHRFLLQRLSTASDGNAPNNSHFSPIIREVNGGTSQVQSLLDGFSGDRPCFHRTTSADCRAAHSITGLTGCNPTCIPAPVASLGQWLGAQERSSATCSTLLIGLASDRPTSHPILQRSQTPTGGELRGDHRRQGGYQKVDVYFLAQYCLLYVWHICCHGLVHSTSCSSVGQLNVQHSPGWVGMQPRE